MATASNVQLKIQSGTDRTVLATWAWNYGNTASYTVRWYYYTGDGIWFRVDDASTTDKYATYNAPSNATQVKFHVKPISKTRKVKKKTTSYWTAGWSTEKIYNFSSNPPTKPSAPSVTIKDFKLTATLDNLDVNASSIQFQVYKDNSTLYKTGTCTITTGHVSYSCTVEAGSEYKVRCRAQRDGLNSEWSEYSDNKNTVPSAPTSIKTIRASSETSVYLEWNAVVNATGYDIEYATKKEHFEGSNQTTQESGIETTHYDLGGLTSGDEYFFRVRATNNEGESGWSEISSVTIGTKPAAPTTWASTTTVVTGESLVLYWVHNSKDGSVQSYAEVELVINGVGEVHTIRPDETATEEELQDKTYTFPIDTTEYVEGSRILWRVRTAGVTNQYGDWSIQRSVDIYAPPTLTMTVKNSNSEVFEVLESFPFYLSAVAGPTTQSPVGYHIAITSSEAYETVDAVGNVKMVNKGDEVYSKYFDIASSLTVEFSANNLDLENNVKYIITCIVTMNSGLTAESTHEFTVGWSETIYEPDAEIGIDENTLTAYIRPYCMDSTGNLVEGVYLSVYRREFDGSFTEIIKNVENSDSTFATDPHPALDYARYRIVATAEDTGAVSYYDVPGYPVDEKSVVLQWAEEWSNFNTVNEDDTAEPSWSGSMLKLPYNIDVSDSHSTDVSLVEYIGRKHPVSYYGTQVGHTSTWNMVIAKDDEETLYGIRRLAAWMGDVYVREPSGSGYWANVSVSFGQKHLDLTIPITLDIVRVEGGM